MRMTDAFDQFQKEVVDKFPININLTFLAFRGLVDPKHDLKMGPLANALGLAHVAVALQNPGEAIPIVAPPDRFDDVEASIRKAITHECKNIPGQIKTAHHVVKYCPEESH